MLEIFRFTQDDKIRALGTILCKIRQTYIAFMLDSPNLN